MSCPIEVIKQNSLKTAKEKFIGNNKSYKEADGIVYIESKFNKPIAELWKEVEKSIKDVKAWALQEFVSPKFTENWVETSVLGETIINIYFKFPKILENAYRLKKEQETTPTQEVIEQPIQNKGGIDFVFEQNPELSNIGTPEQYSQYLESLNKPNTNPILQGNQEAVITPNDKIVFGHPGIGKTFLRESGRTDVIDFDSDYKSRINEEFGLEKGFKARNAFQKSNKEEYQKAVRKLWIEAKKEAKNKGKQLFASDMILLREFANDFDKVITMSKETFVSRAKQRNDYTPGAEGTEGWKQSLDTAISNVDKSKVVSTDKYLSDLFTNTQQEQVKKFAELQERLNNKEFLEGAKNVFESSEELQNVYYGVAGFNKPLDFYEGDTLKIDDKTYTISEKISSKELAKRNGLTISSNVPVYIVNEPLGLRKGGYDTVNNIIILSKNSDKETIQHELIHSVEYNLDKKEIEPLYQKVKNTITEDSFNGFVSWNFKKSISEFIADALSKKVFRDALKKEGLLEEIDNTLSVYSQQLTPQQKQDALNAYTDYIARVSLGIIKNPSSGEYNYESKVKDIVYHGSNQKINQFEVRKEPLIHFGNKNAALQRGNVLNQVVLNIKDLQTIKDGMWFLGTGEGGLLKELLGRNILTTEEVISINEAKNKAIQESPYFHENYRMALPEGEKAGNKKLQEILKDKNIGFEYINFSEDKGSTSYAIPSQEQIHILGSKQDIEGFKQFVKSPTISKEVEQPTVKVEVVSRYSNVDVKANPDKIYVFGDNTQRVGTGGQAQIRNNPNAFGIATKLKPNNNPDAFMTDEDLESNKQVIDSDIAKIKAQNKPLVFPKDGFGTGLAKLKEKAPQTYEYLKQRLLEEFGFNNDTGELSQTPSKEVENKTEDWTQENNDCGI